MEKIIIKKLDSTISEINLVTAFSLEDNNIIIYLTNENPDIVNVTVKTAVGLGSISDELFQKLTEALQTMNEDIFKNNTIDVANTLSEVGPSKKFRISGNFDEVIGNLNTMYQSSGKKVLKAEEKTSFPMGDSVPQEVIPVEPSVDTSSAGDLKTASMENISKEIYGDVSSTSNNIETPIEPFSINNAPLEPKPIQVDSPVDKVIPPEKPVEMPTQVLQSSIGLEEKQSEEKHNESWNPYFGGIDPLSPNFPTVKNPEIFVSPSQTGLEEDLSSLTNVEGLELPSVKDLEYRKVLEGLIGVIEISPEGSLPKELSEAIKFYKEKLYELDEKYKNESNTNNLQP